MYCNIYPLRIRTGSINPSSTHVPNHFRVPPVIYPNTEIVQTNFLAYVSLLSMPILLWGRLRLFNRKSQSLLSRLPRRIAARLPSYSYHQDFRPYIGIGVLLVTSVGSYLTVASFSRTIIPSKIASTSTTSCLIFLSSIASE